MKKMILLDNEKFNWAMADLVELKGLIEDKLIDNDETIIKAIKNILKTIDEAASIVEHSKNGDQFEIVNADPGTYMDVELITELES